MTADEILLVANSKWLSIRGVTDWPTMRRAVRAAQKKALRQIEKFVTAFDEWEMLSALNPDGTSIARNAGGEEERRQIRKRIARIGNYIEGNCK